MSQGHLLVISYRKLLSAKRKRGITMRSPFDKAQGDRSVYTYYLNCNHNILPPVSLASVSYSQRVEGLTRPKGNVKTGALISL